jgi:hypothetical protein
VCGRGSHTRPPGVPQGWRRCCCTTTTRRASPTRSARTKTSCQPSECLCPCACPSAFVACPRASLSQPRSCRCLRAGGVTMQDSRDDKGSERFHPFTPAGHYVSAAPARPHPRACATPLCEMASPEGRSCPAARGAGKARHAQGVVRAIVRACAPARALAWRDTVPRRSIAQLPRAQVRAGLLLGGHDILPLRVRVADADHGRLHLPASQACQLLSDPLPSLTRRSVPRGVPPPAGAVLKQHTSASARPQTACMRPPTQSWRPPVCRWRGNRVCPINRKVC